MSCVGYDTARRAITSGEFWEGMKCVFTGGDPALELALASLIFGGLGFATFVKTGSPVMPVVLAIMFAGVIFGTLPAQFANFGIVVLLLALGVGGVYLYRRLNR